jgi:hypothetical protein
LLSGETDLTNRLAFETIAGTFSDVETLDLLGMQFVDLTAAATLARAAQASPRLRIRVNPSQHELLSVSGTPQAQLQVDLAH